MTKEVLELLITLRDALQGVDLHANQLPDRLELKWKQHGRDDYHFLYRAKDETDNDFLFRFCRDISICFEMNNKANDRSKI